MLEFYSRWAEQKPTLKAVVVYDTMWESTHKMARAIGEGLAEGGANARIMKLRACHRSDIVTEVLDAGAILVGSPTINNNMFPTMADLLFYLKGLKPQNLIGAVFGSYGWSGEAAGHIENILSEMKVELVADSVKVRYVPDGDALAQCFSLGKLVAGELVKRCEGN